MKSSDCPMRLWDYCVERRARVNNMTSRDSFKLQGSNPHTTVTGDQGDISNLCQFDWYEWVHYRNNKAQFPHNKERLGKVLGPSKGVGNEMCQWILEANGEVIPRSTVRPLTIAEKHDPKESMKNLYF